MLIDDLPIIASENITLVHSGKDYFSRLERIISEAEFEIHFQTYLFDYDSTGRQITEALKKAAARNVNVYLLLDGFGSYSFPSEAIDDLRNAGVNVRFFSPLFSANSFYMGRRLHHKVIVTDAKKVLIGGINIADKYHGTATEKAWLDYAVELSCEEIAIPLQKLCHTIYFKKRHIHLAKAASIFSKKMTVRILENDWLKRKKDIYKTYIRSIGNAQDEVIIVGSYFLPGRKLSRALKKASENDVKIKLLLSGISDVPLLRNATLHLYAKMLNYNIELYEWNKSVLHGKAAVVDGHWTTIGSFNLNHLSSYGSIEMNVEINSAEFAGNFLTDLNKTISQCHPITAESLKNDSFFSKYINRLCYWFVRVVLIVITYLPYKRFMKLN